MEVQNKTLKKILEEDDLKNIDQMFCDDFKKDVEYFGTLHHQFQQAQEIKMLKMVVQRLAEKTKVLERSDLPKKRMAAKKNKTDSK